MAIQLHPCDILRNAIVRINVTEANDTNPNSRGVNGCACGVLYDALNHLEGRGVAVPGIYTSEFYLYGASSAVRFCADCGAMEGGRHHSLCSQPTEPVQAFALRSEVQ